MTNLPATVRVRQTRLKLRTPNTLPNDDCEAAEAPGCVRPGKALLRRATITSVPTVTGDPACRPQRRTSRAGPSWRGLGCGDHAGELHDVTSPGSPKLLLARSAGSLTALGPGPVRGPLSAVALMTSLAMVTSCDACNVYNAARTRRSRASPSIDPLILLTQLPSMPSASLTS